MTEGARPRVRPLWQLITLYSLLRVGLFAAVFVVLEAATSIEWPVALFAGAIVSAVVAAFAGRGLRDEMTGLLEQRARDRRARDEEHRRLVGEVVAGRQSRLDKSGAPRTGGARSGAGG